MSRRTGSGRKRSSDSPERGSSFLGGLVSTAFNGCVYLGLFWLALGSGWFDGIISKDDVREVASEVKLWVADTANRRDQFSHMEKQVEVCEGKLTETEVILLTLKQTLLEQQAQKPKATLEGTLDEVTETQADIFKDTFGGE